MAWAALVGLPGEAMEHYIDRTAQVRKLEAAASSDGLQTAAEKAKLSELEDKIREALIIRGSAIFMNNPVKEFQARVREMQTALENIIKAGIGATILQKAHHLVRVAQKKGCVSCWRANGGPGG